MSCIFIDITYHVRHYRRTCVEYMDTVLVAVVAVVAVVLVVLAVVLVELVVVLTVLVGEGTNTVRLQMKR